MYILLLTSPEATLESAGGKGANLVRLTRAGFDVPRGFIVSTNAYREFVQANGLDGVIQQALEGLKPEDADALESASRTIRRAFDQGVLPSGIHQEIQTAYSELNPKSEIENRKSVAVRSSATAEDLPDLSFAGQQDTYLNIIGEEQLLEAVVNCWSSLWTARAIGYRIRNHISHDEAALAVVVQEMVQSDVSGVLFTANPLTGALNESVIDATFGLGEALVSGQVEPDHFVVGRTAGRVGGDVLLPPYRDQMESNQSSEFSVVNKKLGAKAVAARSKAGGGVESIEEKSDAQQTLTESQIQQLAETGQRIQKEYGAPQDIEWAFADGKLYILQARGITSLFPVPKVSFDPLIIWISFGAVQGLVGPLTPLGQDTIRHLAAGAGKMFDVTTKPEDVEVFALAGERIWIKFSDVIRHPLGSRIFKGVLGIIEPSSGQILRSLSADPRVGVGEGKFKFSTARRLIRFVAPIFLQVVRNMLRPETARARFDADIEMYLSTARLPPASNRFERLANIVAYMRERIANAFAFLLPRFIPIMGPSMASLGLLARLSGDTNLALEATRGLPNNVTTEMDLALWETAKLIQADAESKALFAAASAPELARQYQNGTLPSGTQNVIARFLEKYGMRGVGEIDFGQPRWREDPTSVMHTLQSYLQIDPAFAPDVLFSKGERAAQDAIERIAANARKQHGGWLKAKIVRAAARRIRLLMGARESPKFFAIRTMGIAKKQLIEVGQEFADAGTINRADDLTFLKLNELESLSRNESRDWKSLIAERRAVYERELRRRQVPRVLVSDGRAFYEGVGAETDTGDVITGSPVSPGVVEGIVHVVLDPRGVHLVPGEILVCPGTDPAWTPLFMAAGGLVTEVGGMMTHGSVVAREYGIPAVVGVHQATLRLKDGQKIRVDGTQGKIMVLG
ncbi:MAG TPA: PEP/pyruvate-binding domain-containing protein [Anaerolineales bacterium]|nr:PEP/pyruvate-binding domain-containing protein [Anaerolineales bacterium]